MTALSGGAVFTLTSGPDSMVNVYVPPVLDVSYCVPSMSRMTCDSCRYGKLKGKSVVAPSPV